MLSLVIRGLLLLLCGCQAQKQTEKVTEVLETVESFRKEHLIKSAIDYLVDKEIYKNLDLLETLAFLYEENNENLLAAQTFEQLFHADIDKQYIECAFHAGDIYYQLGDIYSAGRCYRLYLDLNPQDYSTWFKLSEIEKQLKHPATALTAYFNGLKTVPKETKFYKKLSELCYDNNMLDAAEFWGKMALKANPQDVYILKILTKIADAHNDRQKVNLYTRRLKELNYDFWEHHPDILKKYEHTIIPEHTMKVTEIDIPHDIHTTQQEIDHTLQLLSPKLKQSVYKNCSIKTISNPLCPNYIY